jgi:hypothetical protein
MGVEPCGAGAYRMRPLHCGRDDRVFGCSNRAKRPGILIPPPQLVTSSYPHDAYCTWSLAFS